MKIKNVFDLIFSMENLYGALEDVSDQRRYNKDVMLFNFNAWDNLKEIRDSVYDGTYTIDKYYIFYVYEPKKRMIMSIKFKHRVVQWAIYRVINPMLIKGYIKDSYGCIPERGPLTAMFRLKYWLEQVNRKDEQWYYLKLDISKYFYRVDMGNVAKIVAGVLAIGGIFFILLIREFGKFIDEVSPYNWGESEVLKDEYKR